VYGELYAVPFADLLILDGFADHYQNGIDNLYVRKIVTVHQKEITGEAFTYVCNKPEMLKKEITGGR
jgi:gamma-glutamylcyclotransferase (GGCT)/AIG2-like uncharacterized protein YtfP